MVRREGEALRSHRARGRKMNSSSSDNDLLELELRVAERTTALETMNAALAAEVAERRAAERALREAARSKDEFLATLAHELRSPLAPLSSAAEILTRAADAPEQRARRERAVTVIGRQVAHMVRLIDDLLDISRAAHGK